MTIARESLDGIEPRHVVAWLTSRGWQQADERLNAVVYRKASETGEGDFEVEIPRHTGFKDYFRRLGEAVTTLSVANHMPATWVLQEMRDSSSDVVRFRATGPGIGNGVVPVDVGSRLIRSASDVLLAASCAAVEPRPVYRTRKPREALDFLDRVQMGPTEAGSFVVALRSHVPPALQPALAAELVEEPFERRSTLMLASAVSEARNAAERAGLGDGMDPFRQAARRGVSANLCDALAQIVDGVEVTELEMRFGWASSRPVAAEIPRHIRLGAGLGPVLREAARQLRATEPTPDFELEGFVIKLTSDDPAQGGTAVVSGAVDDRSRKIQVPMGAEDYAMAIVAHGANSMLKAEGELRKRGRDYRLERVRHVEVVEDEPDDGQE